MSWSPEMAEARRQRRALERAGKPTSKPRTTEALVNAHRSASVVAALNVENKRLVKLAAKLEDALAFRDISRAWKPPRVGYSTSKKTGLRQATPCFVLSDLHIGECVTLAESLGTNKYNREIAAARMSKCWDNMLWLRRDMARTNTAEDVVIFLNGDIISGDIHDELKETNWGGLREQCREARNLIAPGLLAFADETPGQVHVVCIDGNHGRVTHKRQIKTTVEHSAEHFGVYDPLEERVGAGPKGNIVWHVSGAPRYAIDIQGHRVSAQHGDMVRSMGGIGGTLVPLTRWAAKTKDADYYIVGHFHEADAYGPIIKNGALIGESAYTKWLGVESRPPEQVAFLMDRIRGMRRFERVSVAT